MWRLVKTSHNSSKPLSVIEGPPTRSTRGLATLLVCRQDRQVSRPIRLPKLGKQASEVKRLPTEHNRPVPARPLAGVPVPGQLDPVEIRIVQVDGLVGAVIRRPVDRPAMIEQAFERGGQIFARRIVDGEVVQASGDGGG